MTIYTTNQPVATDPLSVSQTYLFNNTNALNTIYGFDHFAFTDDTNSRGLHQKVTTPLYSVAPAYTPPATVADPILYGYTPLDNTGATTTNLPVIQWSRGVSNSVPTPLTSIQGPLAGDSIAIASAIPILDFTGISIAIFELFAFISNISTIGYQVSTTGCYNNTVIPPGGSNFILIGPSIGSSLKAQSSGKVLQLFNNTGSAFTNTVYWTLRFIRIQ